MGFEHLASRQAGDPPMRLAKQYFGPRAASRRGVGTSSLGGLPASRYVPSRNVWQYYRTPGLPDRP